tara:strand:- start:312 stop:719 length:408 start_codon:yes stop_codon:yes gene_type:complete
MQSKKPIYKKPREQINTFEESTWHANDTPMFENEHCAVFKDLYPCVTGHLLFIPKQNNAKTVSEAYKLAYYCGEEWIKEGKMDGFNVGQNIGACSGQTIFWPHIHFIPRKNGDTEPGQSSGIRLSHPNGDHGEYY